MRGLVAVAAAAWVVLAGPAGAAIVTIQMSGVIETKGTGPFTTYEDSPLAIGTPVYATLTFRSNYRAEVGNFTYYTAYRADGAMRLQAGPFSWTEKGDFLDGYPLYQPGVYPYPDRVVPEDALIAMPLIVFESGDFAGFYTTADNHFDLAAPDFEASGFSFDLGEYGYDQYQGPTFKGSFDLASIRLTAVPEPATWMTLIIGFGVGGAFLRRRRSQSSARSFSVKPSGNVAVRAAQLT